MASASYNPQSSGFKNEKDEKKKEFAFEEIISMMKDRIKPFLYNFSIPGYDKDDIYQECLIAIKYKAIKDYDHTKSNLQEISPFDNFACICIRRHLSTKHKSSFQNKTKALNTSISIDEDRSENSDENLFLSDILSDKDFNENFISVIKDKEDKMILFKKLYNKLSIFEKKVFLLYKDKLSYNEMSAYLIEDFSPEQKESIIINKLIKDIKYILRSKAKKNQKLKEKYNSKLEKGKTILDIAKEEAKSINKAESKEILVNKTIKSIDNALSRIKDKSREIYNKWDD